MIKHTDTAFLHRSLLYLNTSHRYTQKNIYILFCLQFIICIIQQALEIGLINVDIMLTFLAKSSLSSSLFIHIIATNIYRGREKENRSNSRLKASTMLKRQFWRAGPTLKSFPCDFNLNGTTISLK